MVVVVWGAGLGVVAAVVEGVEEEVVETGVREGVEAVVLEVEWVVEGRDLGAMVVKLIGRGAEEGAGRDNGVDGASLRRRKLWWWWKWSLGSKVSSIRDGMVSPMATDLTLWFLAFLRPTTSRAIL